MSFVPCCPVGPGRPEAPVAPVTPPVPDDPVAPGSPVLPVDPTAPGKPICPGDPFVPGLPIGPGGPIGPVEPAGPIGPVGPAIPVAPCGPAGPGAPGCAVTTTTTNWSRCHGNSSFSIDNLYDEDHFTGTRFEILYIKYSFEVYPYRPKRSSAFVLVRDQSDE